MRSLCWLSSDLEEDGLPDFLVINGSFVCDLTRDELLVDVDVFVDG